jgi:ABC-2 type transport system permease protein
VGSSAGVGDGDEDRVVNGSVGRLELKNFLAGRAVVAGLVLIFAAGLVAIEHGRRAIESQRSVIRDSPRLEGEHRRKMIALHGGAEAAGPGNLLYYLNFFTTREPSRFAPVALGLRDVTPYNLRVRMLAVEGQIRDAEIGNPDAQSLGHFDLTFLLSFLYPLLVAAFLHDTLSSERESGTWDLIRSHPAPWPRVLMKKAALRFLPIPAVWLATVAVASIVLQLPVDARFGQWIALSLAYLTFWFSVSVLVIVLGRSSSFNALALLSLWLLLAILVPVGSNLAVAWALPASDAFEAALRQREGYHDKWDRPRAETMQAFYSRYPEHATWQAPEDKFSWGWYYAMQQQGDEESAQAAGRFGEVQRRREIWSRRLAWLAPPAMMESAITRLAATGLDTHLAYLESVRRYHEQVRRHFYPMIFRDPPAPPVDWQAVPRHRFSDEGRPAGAALEILMLTAEAAAVVLAACWLSVRKL